MTILNQRSAGVLLHPTSLPGDYAGGDIGPDAFRFIDFLSESGCRVWQMLPIGPTHIDGSPYQCLSVHAANPLMISLEWLDEKGWLDLSSVQINKQSKDFRYACLSLAYEKFIAIAEPEWQTKFDLFIQEKSSWLEDYSLFMAVKESQHCASWHEWPEPLAERHEDVLSQARKDFAYQIKQTQFEQFVFFEQWNELRTYAAKNNVQLFGDMPFYVSHDSADVWAQREAFLLDDSGAAAFVAGVPPDVFSETGQRWGNPLYDWQAMKQDKFSWWVERFRTQLELFDLIRIDHFRGFEACWRIPSTEETAINGEWVDTPGNELLQTLTDKLDTLPLVAEDLGLITQAVIELRQSFSLPGMKILQFAFDGDSKNPYLPHNHQLESVVYTGTHDNDTTLGWYQGLNLKEKRCLHDYIGVKLHSMLDMPWIMNRMALASVANMCILPMQDILSMDSSQRMNMPGTTEGNWTWRFEWQRIWPGLASDLKTLNKIYARI